MILRLTIIRLMTLILSLTCCWHVCFAGNFPKIEKVNISCNNSRLDIDFKLSRISKPKLSVLTLPDKSERLVVDFTNTIIDQVDPNIKLPCASIAESIRSARYSDNVLVIVNLKAGKSYRVGQIYYKQK